MRVKACKHCGAAFETDKPGAYLCPGCALKSRQKSVLRERVCIDCGAVFTGYPKSKRCPHCQTIVNCRRDAERRSNGPKRKLGSIDKCQCCGKDYVVDGGRQRYCKACAPVQTTQNIRSAKRAYMTEKKELFAPLKKESRQYNKICLVCGTVFDAETATVTCSPECAKKLKSYRMAEADYRRGKRKTMPTMIKEDKPND